MHTMNEDKINYPLSSSTWGEDELSAIQNVINSGIYTMGKNVNEYETDFSKFFNSKYSVMVNSGSSANLLMIASLFYRKKNPLKRGDEVIVPAVSWATTYFPLCQYGLKVKFIDIDPHTLNYDLDALKEAITENTRLIVAVNLLGNPNDFRVIEEIISQKDIIVVEDNCESMGAKYQSQYAGTIGLMGTFSSFFSHHISTMEGGVITTNDEEIYHILLCLRAHGWTRNLPENNNVSELSKDPFHNSFHFVLPGYNVRPIEMEGAIGIEQLKKLPQFLKLRNENAKLFQELFINHSYLRVQKEIGVSSWFGFSLVVAKDSPISRDEMVKVLREKGVEVRPIVAGNFTRSPAIQWFDYEIHGKLINADDIHDNGFFIGNHQFDITTKIRDVYNILK